MTPRSVRTGIVAFLLLVGPLLFGCGRCTPSPTPESPEPATEVPPEEPQPEESSPMHPYRDVRSPAVAGSWYPSDPDRLAREVDRFLTAPPADACQDLPLALVLPHAGYRFSGSTAGKAVSQVRGCPVRRVWVLAPTHRLPLRGVGLYDVDAFETPLGYLPLDRVVVDRLEALPGFSVLPRGDAGEHALEIELPLLQRALGAFELVPLLMGDISPEQAREMARAIRKELGEGDLVVVSTDFTHRGPRFGYTPFLGDSDIPQELDELDHGAWKHVADPDPEALAAYIQKTGATICGRNALVLLAALMEPDARARELAYTTSGDLTGDWTDTVSYLAARVDGPAWSGVGPRPGRARLVPAETAEALLSLARRALETWYRDHERLDPDPETLPEGAERVLGAFVTLEKEGSLRGCIGEIEPRRPAWQAVTERAVDAAIHDPRFPKVTADELPHITLDVSLLGPSWEVPGMEHFIIGRHGIVLSKGSRRATFLPQVAPEQDWDRETTLLHLARKAGIAPEDLSEARIEVYEAQVVAEHEQP